MTIKQFDSFTLDLKNGELRKGDSLVKLHPQPAQLLALLVKRAGTTVSREDIQKELWPDDTFVDFDTGINSCVRQIRTVLKDDAEKPRFIKTVPKRGYRFIVAVEGDEEPETKPEPSRRKRWLLPVAALVAVAVGVAVWLLRPPPEEKTQPSIAVLYFENASGDSELDWLRTGLTEMLVTDLSQIPNVAVVSTNRLFQILKGLDQQDEQVFSADVVRKVSERAQTNKVILGSFMKAGDRIRIDIQVLEPASAEILTTEKVEGEGESSLFTMVDSLSRRVQSHLGIESATPLKESTLEQMTTDSIEAYRYYIEAMEMVKRAKSSEALAFLEKAIEADPTFAEGLMNASIMHSNLGHETEAWEYAQRALKHSARARPPRQAIMEAWTYAMKEETYGLAIEAGKRAARLNEGPGQEQARTRLGPLHWAARRLLVLERLDEAIEIWEGMGARKLPATYLHITLARAYSLRGDRQNAEAVMREYVEMFPDRAAAWGGLGTTLTQWGKLDEALEMFQKQEELGPGRLGPYGNRYDVYILREAWDEAEAAAKLLGTSNDPTQIWRSHMLLATINLFHGKVDEAVEHLVPTVRSFSTGSSNTAGARNLTAQVLLIKDEATLALEEARKAQIEGKGQSAEWEGIFLESMALGRLGRMDEAEKAADKLLERTAPIPTLKEKRRHHWLLGELALMQVDAARAVQELEKAQSMLLPRGFPGQHVSIWFSLGSAYRTAGEEDEAAKWFERIVESTNEHTRNPVPYVRSFYFLGKINETRGEMEKAREFYRRFYEYWKDGDLDRERVDEARQKIR